MWYYARGEEQVGPLDEQSFARLAAEGAIGPDTLVWREGMADWVPYRTTQPAANTPAPGGAMVQCVECGNPIPQDDAVFFEGQAVCATCKPYYFQRLREGGIGADQLVFASIGKRFLALLIDSIIFGIMLVLILFGLMAVAIGLSAGNEPSEEVAGLIGLLYVALYGGGFAFYMTWFVGRYGATPGKMALGIKIVRGDGTRVSYLRAFGRMLGHQLSGMVLYLGYVVAFFDDEKRALHDMICDTRVIDTR